MLRRRFSAMRERLFSHIGRVDRQMAQHLVSRGMK
jgi:hypothetical protein